jgi:hypothetical protein
LADSLGIVMDLDPSPTAQKLTDPTGFGSQKNNESSRKVQVVLGFTVPDYSGTLLILVLFNLKMLFGVVFNFLVCVLGNISKGDTVTVFNCHLASLRNQKCLGRQIIHTYYDKYR